MCCHIVFKQSHADLQIHLKSEKFANIDTKKTKIGLSLGIFRTFLECDMDVLKDVSKEVSTGWVD